MDEYLNDENTFKRLSQEYNNYKSLVVPFDFDNTVYDYHNRGNTYAKVIELLRKLKSVGCYLIIFTANDDPNFVTNYYEDNNIPFDAINENPPFYARAGLSSAYRTLTRLLQHIKNQL